MADKTSASDSAAQKTPTKEEYPIQKPSFRKAEFECTQAKDSAQRDTATHEYPYIDGADVEDLGRKARQITMTATFFGDGYTDKLQNLLVQLETPGPGELIHPVFGSIANAQVLSYQVAHQADNPNSCSVEMSFVEATPGARIFTEKKAVQKAEEIKEKTEEANKKGVSALGYFSEQLTAAKTWMASLSGLSAVTTAQGWINDANAFKKLLIETIAQVRITLNGDDESKGILGTALELAQLPKSFAEAIASSLNGLVDLSGFSSNLLIPKWKDLKAKMGDIVKLPKAADGNKKAETGTTDGSSSSGGSASGGESSSGGDTPSKISDTSSEVQADVVTAMLSLLASTTLAEAAADIFSAESENPTLSPPDIELIANDVREFTQETIELHRAIYPIEVSRPVTEALKDLALSVQEAALGIMEARPPLINRVVEARSNLQLCAFKWYGDYTRSTELARLNPLLRDPNEIQAGDILNAYAR